MIMNEARTVGEQRETADSIMTYQQMLSSGFGSDAGGASQETRRIELICE